MLTWLFKIYHANGKETDLTFTIKSEDLKKTEKLIKENKNINFRKLIF